MANVYQTVFGGNLVAPALPTYLALNISANTVLGWPLESNITSPSAAEIIDVTATAPGLTIQLSDARQVSTGYCALFNNVGANTVTILDAQGNALMAPASGQAWQIYLADNSTLQGTWRVFQYGAGVSNANAASLAGLGLKAISTTLNERIVINPQGANYGVQVGDRAACVEWTGGAGGVFTLPTVAAAGSDWFCYIKNSGTGILTLSPQGGSTIDGTANKTFNPNDSAIVCCDGTNFFTMGFGQSVASSFNFVTISLAGASGNVILNGAQLNRISYKFTGTLAGNTTVVVPASIQQYWVDNETTGAFTLTISAGGVGSTYTVPQATRVILYCDGLNIVNAITSGGITFADGTAAAPSITFASDLALGLYKAGADVLGISTAGAQRVTVNASGQVIINAAVSGVALSVNGSAAPGPAVTQATFVNTGGTAVTFHDTTNSVEAEIGTTTSPNSGYVGTFTNHEFDIRTNNTSRITVSANGNVTVNQPVTGVAAVIQGVGASNDVLQVIGASNVGPLATFDSGGATGSFLRYRGNSADVGYWGSGNRVFSGAIADFAITAVGANNLQLGTNSVERIRINGSGGVTVNAPSSGTALQAVGLANANTVAFTGAGTTGQSFGLQILAGTNSSDYALKITNQGNSSTYVLVRGDGLVQAIDQGGSLQDVGWRGTPINLPGVNYTLQLSDRGKTVRAASAGLTFTVPANVFSAGDVVTILMDAGASVTIAQGTSLTLNWAGNAGTTGSRTLTGSGLATVLFYSTTGAVISGAGLS